MSCHTVLLSVVLMNPVRAPLPQGQCDDVCVWLHSSFQLERMVSSDHLCVMPFLGTHVCCTGHRNGQPSEALHIAGEYAEFGGCPQLRTEAHMQRVMFSLSLGFFSFCLFTERSALMLALFSSRQFP